MNQNKTKKETRHQIHTKNGSLPASRLSPTLADVSSADHKDLILPKTNDESWAGVEMPPKLNLFNLFVSRSTADGVCFRRRRQFTTSSVLLLLFVVTLLLLVVDVFNSFGEPLIIIILFYIYMNALFKWCVKYIYFVCGLSLY